MIDILKQKSESTFTHSALKVLVTKVGLKCYLDKRVTSYRNFFKGGSYMLHRPVVRVFSAYLVHAIIQPLGGSEDIYIFLTSCH